MTTKAGNAGKADIAGKCLKEICLRVLYLCLLAKCQCISFKYLRLNLNIYNKSI